MSSGSEQKVVPERDQIQGGLRQGAGPFQFASAKVEGEIEGHDRLGQSHVGPGMVALARPLADPIGVGGGGFGRPRIALSRSEGRKQPQVAVATRFDLAADVGASCGEVSDARQGRPRPGGHHHRPFHPVRMRQGPGQRLHSSKAPSHHHFPPLDAKAFSQAILGIDNVADREPGEFDAPRFVRIWSKRKWTCAPPRSLPRPPSRSPNSDRCRSPSPVRSGRPTIRVFRPAMAPGPAGGRKRPPRRTRRRKKLWQTRIALERSALGRPQLPQWSSRWVNAPPSRAKGRSGVARTTRFHREGRREFDMRLKLRLARCSVSLVADRIDPSLPHDTQRPRSKRWLRRG